MASSSSSSSSESADIVKVLTWNINGLKAKLKDARRSPLLEIFGEYDVVLLQETKIGKMANGKNDDKDWTLINDELSEDYDIVKLKDEEQKKNEKKEDKKEKKEEKENATMYMTYFSSNSKGVGIIINKPHTLLKPFSKGGYYAWVHVEIDGQKYMFVSVYWHHKHPDLISNLMREILRSFSEGSDDFKCRLVIGGDFNTTLDPDLDLITENKNHDPRRIKLKDFLSSLKLSDVWREIKNLNGMNKDECMYTRFWNHKNKKTKKTKKTTKRASRLDYIFMLEDDVKYVVSCEILKNIALSNHRPVSLTLNSTAIQQRREEIREE